RGDGRWSRDRGGVAAARVRSVLHDERGRQGNGARTERVIRDRAGARRTHLAVVDKRRGRVVLRRAADCRRGAAAAKAAAGPDLTRAIQGTEGAGGGG